MNRLVNSIKSLLMTVLLGTFVIGNTMPEASAMSHADSMQSHAQMQSSMMNSSMEDNHCDEMSSPSNDECCSDNVCDCVCVTGFSGYALASVDIAVNCQRALATSLTSYQLKPKASVKPSPPPIN